MSNVGRPNFDWALSAMTKAVESQATAAAQVQYRLDATMRLNIFQKRHEYPPLSRCNGNGGGSRQAFPSKEARLGVALSQTGKNVLPSKHCLPPCCLCTVLRCNFGGDSGGGYGYIGEVVGVRDNLSIFTAFRHQSPTYHRP